MPKNISNCEKIEKFIRKKIVENSSRVIKLLNI